VDVAVTPGGLPRGTLSGTSVLVVDVLRASTTIITALANGCAAIVPVGDPREARRRAAGVPGALVAGERGGEPLGGFDLGNSPLEYTALRVRGRTVVITTSNGTGALLAVRSAPRVGVAALVNASAAAAWAAGARHDVLIVCAGDRGRQSLEDWVCAGLLVERVRGTAAGIAASRAALDAARAAAGYGTDIARLAHDSPWARRLALAGRTADVAACLRLDTTRVVPEYRPDVDKVLAGHG